MISHIILAAGKGTRMRSSLPKVLQPLAGRPILAHVLEQSQQAGAEQQIVVYGYGGDEVQARFSHQDIAWVHQAEQKGTGHAVQYALPEVSGDIVVVLVGDALLIQSKALQQLAAKCPAEGMSLLTAIAPDATGLGRIIRNERGDVAAIVEHKDASPEQRAITEINTGIMCFSKALLEQCLPNLSANNAQGELYLTDMVAMAVDLKRKVIAVNAGFDETMGVNDKQQLAQAERIYQQRQAEALLAQGCTLVDANRLDVRGELQIGTDVFIDVNVVFEGDVVLGDNVVIEPNCVIKDSKIGSGTRIKAFSHIDGASIASHCDIGPYARLRPGAILHDKAKAGNFVEIKKSSIGQGAKINHLSYIGDAVIGERVNVGAGTITCNYDGKNKFTTTINAGAFIGSNTALVAPIVIGENARVAAGSTLTKDVEDGALAFGRAKQVVKKSR